MANQKSTSVLFQSGLDQAIGNGTYPNFALKYFVPIYDERTDINVHTEIGVGSTSAIYTSASISSSAATTVSPSDIEGDILWQNDNSIHQYRINEDKNILYVPTGTDYSSNIVSTNLESPFEQITTVEEGGTVYTPQKSGTIAISGTNVTAESTPGQFNSDTGWTLLNNSTLNYSSWDKDNLLNTIVFSGRNGDTGTYTITIPESYGSTKINKVLIFIQEVNNDGTDTSTSPIPFSVVCMKDPANIYSTTDTNNTSSVNGAQFRVSLSFSPTTSSEVTYTPDERWNVATASGTTDGPTPITYKGDVLIGPGEGPGATNSPNAKLDIIRTDGKLLRLADSDYNDDKGWLVEKNAKGLHLYDEEDGYSSTKSMMFSKPPGVYLGSFTHNIGMAHTSRLDALTYSLINYSNQTTSTLKVENSVINGLNIEHTETSDSLIVGNSSDTQTTLQSLVAVKDTTFGGTARQSVVASDDSTFQTSPNKSLAIVDGVTINSVDNSILIGQNLNVNGSISGSVVHLAAFDVVDASLTSVVAHGFNNTISYGITYGIINGDENTINETSNNIQILGTENGLGTSNTYLKGSKNRTFNTSGINSASGHIFIDGFRNTVEYDSTQTDNTEIKFINVCGDGNYIRNAKQVYVLGGQEQASAVNASNFSNKIQYSDRAYAIGNGNKITNGKGVTTIGINNVAEFGQSQSDLFQNSLLIGYDNTIFTSVVSGQPQSAGINQIFGSSNAINAVPFCEIAASFNNIIGHGNTFTVNSGSGQSAANVSQLFIGGSGNGIEHNQRNQLTSVNLFGNNNKIIEDSSVGDTAPTLESVVINGTGITISANTASSADIADLKNLNVIGVNGAATNEDLNTPYVRFLTSKTAAYDTTPIYGGINNVIMNGVSATANYGVGMAFGYQQITAGPQGVRQMISIPMCNDGTSNYSDDNSNPFNKGNSYYGIPKLAELIALRAAGSYVPRGTLCYDEPSGAADYCTLLLFNTDS